LVDGLSAVKPHTNGLGWPVASLANCFSPPLRAFALQQRPGFLSA
jgi:hypothetical protein